MASGAPFAAARALHGGEPTRHPPQVRAIRLIVAAAQAGRALVAQPSRFFFQVATSANWLNGTTNGPRLLSLMRAVATLAER